MLRIKFHDKVYHHYYFKTYKYQPPHGVPSPLTHTNPTTKDSTESNITHPLSTSLAYNIYPFNSHTHLVQLLTPILYNQIPTKLVQSFTITYVSCYTYKPTNKILGQHWYMHFTKLSLHGRENVMTKTKMNPSQPSAPLAKHVNPNIQAIDDCCI